MYIKLEDIIEGIHNLSNVVTIGSESVVTINDIYSVLYNVNSYNIEELKLMEDDLK